ncbi:Flp family type IVb pilin [Parvibaculum sp.]|uniref:Flp family type IVb pilin n=1 Tax=Parvibaculum sp. TaxID=2024848 RepID=UPI0032118546
MRAITAQIEFQRFQRDERGATAIEYSLILAIIATGVIGVLSVLGGDLAALFQPLAAYFG